MLRARSQSPQQFPKESQLDLPYKPKTLDDLDRFCSPVPQLGSRLDLDGCSTAEPSSPLSTMHPSPSPWASEGQGVSSLDWRTIQDCPPQNFPKRAAAAAPLNFGLTARIPFRDLFAMDYDSLSAADQLPPYPYVAPVTPPPLLTEAAWLEALEAWPEASTAAALPSQPLLETPRKAIIREDCLNTAPGAPKKIRMEQTQMWQALQLDSVSDVREALTDDPDAAWTPFWECNWEPPLCRASRRISDPEIVSILIEHRADVNVADREGDTPLALLIAAAESYPSDEILPRRLDLSIPTPIMASVESFQTVAPSREERVQKITSILTNAGADTGDLSRS